MTTTARATTTATAAATSTADASAQLYARHSRMVFGVCRALLRDPVEAEDAAQQVFLSAHRSLLNGAEPREPAAWLATIARNECWARVRSRMREPLPTDAADAAGGVDPVYEAIRRADLAALRRAIRTLPRQQRDALLLREFGGLRYDELAAALAVTEPAVESLLFRARARLRLQLQPLRASLVPLVRWLVGGGAPALAAKAAAVGLVTGTAVIAPEVVDRHHAPPPAPAQRARVVHVAAPRPEAVALPSFRVPAVRHTTTAARAEATHEVEAVGMTVHRNRTEGDSHDGGTTTAPGPTATQTTGGGDDHGGEAAVLPAAITTTGGGDGHDGGAADGPGGSGGTDG